MGNYKITSKDLIIKHQRDLESIGSKFAERWRLYINNSRDFAIKKEKEKSTNKCRVDSAEKSIQKYFSLTEGWIEQK